MGGIGKVKVYVLKENGVIDRNIFREYVKRDVRVREATR